MNPTTRRMSFSSLRRCAATLVFAAILPAQVDLGLGKMWTFERPPLDYFAREYGFRPDGDWLRNVMLASLKFGRGCSASFVSPHGLILTNHHCVRDAIAKVQGDADWVRDGFVAKDHAGEVRLTGLTVQQLVQTKDVTARMLDGIAADAAPEVAAERRQRNKEAILAEARRDSALSPQLVELFSGASWQLYQYRVFDDVRLCMAPHLQTASFGGDPDNFVYPRYDIDFSFCRAYQDGKPADTAANYFRWKDEGASGGDLVFLTGNPGRTQRLLTAAQLDYLREARYPRVRQLIDNRIAIMRRFAAVDAAAEKRLRTMILGFENAQKLYRGEYAALCSSGLRDRKLAAEAALQQRVEAEPKLRARYGGLWRQLAAVAQQKRTLEPGLNFHTAGGSPLLMRAEALLAFAEHGGEDRAKAVRDVHVSDDALQSAFFVDHLARGKLWLPKDDPYLARVLDGAEPEAAVRGLQQGSRLGDDEVVQQLLAGGKAAIDACHDPALEIARVLAPLAIAHRCVNDQLTATEQALGAELARALFEVYGDQISPDATSTLRLSDGRVMGYEYNGTVAPWRTVFHGLYARSAEFDGQPPFDLPAAWREAESRIELRAAVDFVCTVDSTGGNSGSPVIDRDRRLVGLLFDGNIESMANEFFYGETVERSVCVHPQAIVEALGKVYDCQRLIDELHLPR